MYPKSALLPYLLAFNLCLPAETLPPEIRSALDTIQPTDLKGDLSFLASDSLQGRYTPSPGLDIAADFIASRFRAIGLQPIDDSGYFQIAPMIDRRLPKIATPLIAHEGDSPITVEPAKIQVASAGHALHLANATVLKVPPGAISKLKPEQLNGKVILVSGDPTTCAFAPGDSDSPCAPTRAFRHIVAASRALAEIELINKVYLGAGTQLLSKEEADSDAPPLIRVESSELGAALENSAPLTLSLDVAAPEDQPVNLKNVIGILPGSDPALKPTALLLTAHYDHIGTSDTSTGLTYSKPNPSDRIFNGANDDGSGVVSVIEIARALAHLHPKRSIVFMTFFGEERGLIGSTWYAAHPVFPLAKTIADVNLEQLGRTDSNKGPEIGNATVTGFDFSDVTRYLEAAGKQTGIDIYPDTPGDDDYFTLSDNAAFARVGIPAHTLCVAFEYPDYHAVGDEWPKIDYDNMAKVDRAVALAVWNLANAKQPPRWNAENPKTNPYREIPRTPDALPRRIDQ